MLVRACREKKTSDTGAQVNNMCLVAETKASRPSQGNELRERERFVSVIKDIHFNLCRSIVYVGPICVYRWAVGL